MSSLGGTHHFKLLLFAAVLMASAACGYGESADKPAKLSGGGLGKGDRGLGGGLGKKAQEEAVTNAPAAFAHSFYVHLPPGYESDKNKKWPAVVHLHGGGYNGAAQGLLKIFGDYARKNFVILILRNNGTAWWRSNKVLPIVEHVIKTYRIDPDRFYGTGHSLGGFGILECALVKPEIFTAIVPGSGGRPLEAFGPAFKKGNVAVWLHCGDGDAPNVDDLDSLWLILAKENINARYTRIPGYGHSTEWFFLPQETIFKWFLTMDKKKNLAPSGGGGGGGGMGGGKMAMSKPSGLQEKKPTLGNKPGLTDKTAPKDEKPQGLTKDQARQILDAARKTFNPGDWSVIEEMVRVQKAAGAKNGVPTYPGVLMGLVDIGQVSDWPCYETPASMAYQASTGKAKGMGR